MRPGASETSGFHALSAGNTGQLPSEPFWSPVPLGAARRAASAVGREAVGGGGGGARCGGRSGGGGGGAGSAGSAHAARLAASAATSATIRTFLRFIRRYRHVRRARRLEVAHASDDPPTMRSGVRVDPESRERQPRALPHVRRPARDRGGRRARGSRRPAGGDAGTARPGIADIAFWVVVWGVIGARLYHVITDYQLFEHDWAACSRSGRAASSIWGAVIGGALAVIVITRRRHMPTLVVMDCLAPGAPRRAGDRPLGKLVQPGAVREADHAPVGPRDLARAPAGRDTRSTRRSNPRSSTSRSTACSIVGILLLVERKLPLKQGQTFALYVIFYTFGRFWFENLRIDPAHDIGPLRVNAWVSVVIFAFGVGWFWWLGRHEPPPASTRPRSLGGKRRKLG